MLILNAAYDASRNERLGAFAEHFHSRQQTASSLQTTTSQHKCPQHLHFSHTALALSLALQTLHEPCNTVSELKQWKIKYQ